MISTRRLARLCKIRGQYVVFKTGDLNTEPATILLEYRQQIHRCRPICKKRWRNWPLPLITLGYPIQTWQVKAWVTTATRRLAIGVSRIFPSVQAWHYRNTEISECLSLWRTSHRYRHATIAHIIALGSAASIYPGCRWRNGSDHDNGIQRRTMPHTTGIRFGSANLLPEKLACNASWLHDNRTRLERRRHYHVQRQHVQGSWVQ